MRCRCGYMMEKQDGVNGRVVYTCLNCGRKVKKNKNTC